MKRPSRSFSSPSRRSEGKSPSGKTRTVSASPLFDLADSAAEANANPANFKAVRRFVAKCSAKVTSPTRAQKEQGPIADIIDIRTTRCDRVSLNASGSFETTDLRKGQTCSRLCCGLVFACSRFREQEPPGEKGRFNGATFFERGRLQPAT